MDIKILMLEDVAQDADLICRQLSRDNLKFVSKRVGTQSEFLYSLHAFNPDIILSDHSLPQFNSLVALEIVKQTAKTTPFIFVTGAVSEEFAVTCIKSGADDYILKNNLSRLSSAIKSSLKKRMLESENNVIKALNREIKKKNEELHLMNQEKDRFMGIVSHDLQNHISSMMLTLSLFAKNVRSMNMNEQQWAYVKRLNRSATNMQKLLSDFLTINQIQRVGIKPIYSLVNMGNLVGEIIEGYEYMLQRKKINIKFDNNCKGSFFRTDMSYLSIIADNLISNAVKYTSRGKSIHVQVYKYGGKYTLEVKNQGPSIPPEDIPKLYGRFQKLTPKPTAGEPSNGLGLSIVKDLVDALNAGITCKSAENETVFTVIFK